MKVYIVLGYDSVAWENLDWTIAAIRPTLKKALEFGSLNIRGEFKVIEYDMSTESDLIEESFIAIEYFYKCWNEKGELISKEGFPI